MQGTAFMTAPQERHVGNLHKIRSSTLAEEDYSDGVSSSEVAASTVTDPSPRLTKNMSGAKNSTQASSATGLELLSQVSLLQGPVVPKQNVQRPTFAPPAAPHMVLGPKLEPGPSYAAALQAGNQMRAMQAQPFMVPFAPPLAMAPVSIPPPEGSTRQYIDRINDCDVLCGRGNRSNCHPGNLRFRYIVNEMKPMYRAANTKTTKTDLSQAIVEHVYSYGGRFLKKDEDKGRYHILSITESRTKTSQALRERKTM